MPRVNIKYKFVKDALIDTIHRIEFQGNETKYWNDRITSNQYEGKVKNVPVTNLINIEVKVSGASQAAWSLEVSVIKIKKSGIDDEGKPRYVEEGEPKKIEKFPIKDKVGENTIGYHDKTYKIKWS